jgi:hypothetical protein
MQNDIVVLVSSSDNTQDVLRQVFPSLRHFWPDCPFPIYVGKNGPQCVPHGCRAVFAPRSDWRSELSHQLGQISATHVLLLLDDFLFTAPVDTVKIVRVIDDAFRFDRSYVRLRSLQRALLPALWSRCVRPRGTDLLETIPRHLPYYSGLQPALWRVSHLRACLMAANDIWSFEHIVDEAEPHFAVRATVLHCTHVVERGRWLPKAENLFRHAGLVFAPGVRRSWPRSTQTRLAFGALKFALFGYAGVRFRRALARFGLRQSRLAAGSIRTVDRRVNRLG